jgi:hypothetical protein
MVENVAAWQISPATDRISIAASGQRSDRAAQRTYETLRPSRSLRQFPIPDLFYFVPYVPYAVNSFIPLRLCRNRCMALL